MKQDIKQKNKSSWNTNSTFKRKLNKVELAPLTLAHEGQATVTFRNVGPEGRLFLAVLHLRPSDEEQQRAVSLDSTVNALVTLCLSGEWQQSTPSLCNFKTLSTDPTSRDLKAGMEEKKCINIPTHKIEQASTHPKQPSNCGYRHLSAPGPSPSQGQPLYRRMAGAPN